MSGAKGLSKERKRLLATYEQLDEGRRASLVAFAEFLHAQQPPVVENLVINPIPRPEEEGVPAAIRRLRETYPAVETRDLLDAVSACMSGHLLRGRPAGEVIDELEELFATAHQKAVDARDEE